MCAWIVRVAAGRKSFRLLEAAPGKIAETLKEKGFQMARRGRSPRDPQTGLKESTIQSLDERHLNDAGRVTLAVLPDCNVFGLSNIAAAAGVSPQTLKRRLECGSAEFIHHHVVSLAYSPNAPKRGSVTLWATHVASAQAAGEMLRSQSQAAQVRSLAPCRFRSFKIRDKND